MYHRFLPDYPFIEEQDFFRSIVAKKEFWEKTDTPDFFQHQVNIARYLTQWTLYDSLFLYHEMGTGKSGVTVALTELCRRDSEFKKVLYITHNQTQIDNYKNEIMKFSSRLRTLYEQDTKELVDAEKKQRRWNSILHQDGYEFMTMGTVHNQFHERTDDWLKQRFENSIIIIDEAHHLVQTNQDQDTKAFESLLRLVRLLDIKKLLVMSGTPIRDQPDEIIPLLQLVLPQEIARSLPTRPDFTREFFEIDSTVSNKMHFYKWKPGAKDRFRNIIRGRVSYLRREMSVVPISYEGEIFPPLQSLRIVYNPMTSIQNALYSEFFRLDVRSEDDEEDDDLVKKASSFYNKSKHASLFVFPEDNFDLTADDLWKRQGRAANQAIHPRTFKLQTDFIRQITGGDTNVQLLDRSLLLELLEQYSTTYARVIREIITHPDELVYIYCDIVKSSGIMMLQAILRSLFGFDLVASPKQMSYTEGDRIIVLNDELTREEDFQQLIQYFNDPANKHGKFCRVIISTKKTKEGISLKNVQQIHITTPSWNMGDMSQAMARSLRARSHDEGLRVRIFLHAAVPTEEDDTSKPQFLRSVDFRRYLRSEIKEKNTKLIDRVFMESSWDCMMNMNVNKNTGRTTDGSRNCEYDTCDYQCEGVSLTDPQGTEDSNWILYYSSVIEDHLRTQIRSLFRQKSVYTKEELYEALSAITTDHIVIEKTLQKIVYSPVVLRDRHLFPCFLSYNRHSYFLTDNPFLPDPLGNYQAYYQQNPATIISFPLQNVLDGYIYKNLGYFISQLLGLIRRNHSNAVDLFESLPLLVQQLFCEETLFQEARHPDRVKLPLRQWFKTNFIKKGFVATPSKVEHHFLPNPKNKRVLDLSNLTNWVDG